MITVLVSIGNRIRVWALKKHNFMESIIDVLSCIESWASKMRLLWGCFSPVSVLFVVYTVLLFICEITYNFWLDLLKFYSCKW